MIQIFDNITTKNKIKLVSPINLINNNLNKVKEVKINLNNIMEKRLLNIEHNLDNLINTLKLVNPLNILSNGYSLVRKKDKVIKSIKEIKKDDEVNIKLYEGEFIAQVKEITK